jgi:uncharacterized protein YndB with AHSA1/START domain
MAKFTRLVGIALGAIALLFGLGFLLPAHAHVERSIVIQAPPEQIFPQVSDLSAWEAWSPWATLDPDAQMTLEGEGVGQRMIWSSENPQVGEGSQVVTALEAPRYLQTHLEFAGQGIAEAAFELKPMGEGQTQVTWSLDSEMREGVPLAMQPVSSYMGLLMDSMVGHDYETGLQNLKTLIEGEAA